VDGNVNSRGARMRFSALSLCALAIGCPSGATQPAAATQGSGAKAASAAAGGGAGRDGSAGRFGGRSGSDGSAAVGGSSANGGASAGCGATAGCGASANGGASAGCGATAASGAGANCCASVNGGASAGATADCGATAGGAGAGAGSVDAGAAAPPRPELVYVSGYGPDIRVFTLDRSSGALAPQSTAPAGMSASYLAIAPDARFLYAINEADAQASQVVAFAIDASDGHLTQINTAMTGGSGSPFLAVDPSGHWLAVAHYTSGETSLLPIRDDGSVGDPKVIDKGPGAGCMQAHQAVFDASGTHLLVPCLGSNFVIQFKFSAGQLTYNEPATVAVSGGPRHLALDPSEHHAYVLSELESTITSFAYDATTGRLSDPQVISSVQTQAGASAQIVVHPSGQWLYVSNRAENSLGLFSIDAQGRPHPAAFQTDMIATPRDFSVDPLGHFLILANQDGAQNVLVYSIAPADGQLSRTQVVPVGENPTFTRALVLP
jgi:6-phosphogluconolactonase